MADLFHRVSIRKYQAKKGRTGKTGLYSEGVHGSTICL